MPDCLQAAFLPAEQIGKGVAPGKKEGNDQLVVIGFSIKRTFVLYHLLRNKKQIGKPVVTGVGAVCCLCLLYTSCFMSPLPILQKKREFASYSLKIVKKS